MDESVKALRNNDVDALLHNSYVWSYVLQKPSYSDLSVQPSAMFSMDFRVGAQDTPSGREIIKRLNSGIAELTDTQRQAVILDYTSRRLYYNTFSDFLFEQWHFLLLGTLLFVSMIVIILRRQRKLRLEHEAKMRQMTDHDPLTGVLSLNGFRKRAEELLKLHPDIQYIISYSNIKNFKYINDSLGMDAGDELLRFWAESTQTVISGLDAFARIEADHFAMLRHISGDGQMATDTKIVFEPVRDFFINRNEKMRVQICTGVYILSQASARTSRRCCFLPL